MKDYSIGLDIGTSSVGWAVIDDDYKIIKKGKHPLWGVRLFEEAHTAAERRLKRNVRRRYARRRERINLLRKEFEGYVDNEFFEVLDDFFYVNYDEKKRHKIDDKFKKDASAYYKKYPTIYHLRNHLVNSTEKEDVRLVYLALHHIIKYRGNFLKEGKKFNISNININDDFASLVNAINSCESLNVTFESVDDIDFEKIMLINNKKDKEKELNAIFSANIISNLDVDIKSFYTILSKLLAGVGNGDLFKMFDIEPEDDTKLSISFNGDDYDKNIENIEKYFPDYVEIIEAAKLIFDDTYLKLIFNKDGVNSISTLMIKNYDEHQKDLELLKKVFKNNKDTRCLFKGKNKNTQRTGIYGLYLSKLITNDVFIKEINKLSEKLNDDEKYIYDNELLPRLDSGDFMPLISSVDNGKYPYQLNLDELIKIIENQGKYYPFLLEKVGDCYRIQKILEFKIPYYVGPLSNDRGKKFDYHWLIRNEGYENVKITPYNFDDVVNRNDTAEQFIMRMVSNCTYLLGEKAMPADSILYSEYKVLNELKQIKIGGVPLDVPNVTFIFENFFKKSDKNNDKAFKQFLLENRDKFNYGNGIDVTGYSASNGFANNMKSYLDFFGENGLFINTNYKIQDAEQIIEWVTIFEDKSILKEKVMNTYSELSDNVVNKICNLKYKGWSSLSKKLLTQVVCFDRDMGVDSSIIDIMRNTPKNFMQIVSRKEFKNEIDRLNSNELNGKTNINDVVSDLATSPANKRGIIQAIKIVKAITKKMGYSPKKICIEMARGEGEKNKRTSSRKDQILDLYKNFKINTIDTFNNVSGQIYDYENDDLKNRALFLYFMQCGKCMYCGHNLDVSNLDNTCDIDHIIPQSLYKDDSFDNTVLVCKGCNSLKSGSNVVPKQFKDKMKPLWDILKDNKYISSKKHDRLCRDFYKDSDIQGFVNRQLVETRQVTKHVANILNNIYPDTDIVYLHADLSSSYRKRYELYKFRDLNDLHHAHDAYLAAVLGNYKKKYFDFDNDEYRKDFKNKANDVSNLFRRLKESGTEHNMKYGYIINSLDNDYGYVYSNCSSDEIRLINESITNNLYRNDILVSYKQYENDGAFTGETIFGRKAAETSRIPLKKKLDPNIYGFKSNGEYSCYAIIGVGESRYLLPKPLYIADVYDLKKYFANLLKVDVDDVNIINDKVLRNTVAIIDGCEVILNAGYKKQVEFKNLKQLFFSKDVYFRNKKVIYSLMNNTDISLSDNSLRISYIELIEEMRIKSLNINILKTVSKPLHNCDLDSLSLDDLKTMVLKGFDILRARSKKNNQISKSNPSDLCFVYADILGLNKKVIHIDKIGE